MTNASKPPPDADWSWKRVALAALLLSIAYYAGAAIGFRLTFRPQPVSTLWLPNALVMAACLVVRTRFWWLLPLAVLPPHLLVELRAGVPPLMVLCWFVSNSAEALLGAGLVRRWVGHPVRLDSYRKVAAFIFLAALLAPALSSFLDAGFVALNGWGESAYWSVWRSRFFSNSLAMLTVVPMVVAWANVRVSRIVRAPPLCFVEGALLIAGLIGSSVVAFYDLPGRTHDTPQLLYGPIIFLLWATLRFGPPGATTSLLGVIFLSVWSAVNDRGPFVARTAAENAFALQLLFSGIAITILFVTARIEERWRALQAANLKTQQLRLALDAAQAGMWDFSLTDGSCEFSEEAERVFGISPPGSVRTAYEFVDRVHPSDRAMVSSAIETVLVSGQGMELEFRVLFAHGAVRWVRTKGHSVPDRSGRPVRIVGLCADITTRKRQEAVTARQHGILEMIAVGAPFQTTLDALADLIETESPELLCSLLLLDADGVHVRHACAPSLPEAYTLAIDGCAIGPRAGSCGKAMYTRTRVVAEDILEDPVWEDYRDVATLHGLRSCCSSPIISEQGRVLGCLGVYSREPRHPSDAEINLIDFATHIAAIVMEHKRAELESLEQRTALAHLSRVVMLGEVSAMIAHELNQPLTVILSNAEAVRRLLRDKNPRPADLLPMVEEVVAADLRASEVIHRLRAMLKKGTAEEGPVDLNEVATSTLELARGDLAAHRVHADTRLAPRLPQVLGDRVQLQQVVLNLIVNACDAMRTTASGERRLTLETRLSTAGDQVELCVTDRGTGIPAELLSRIFEPFFTMKDNGLGLGLPICQSIALAHRGKLWAESTPGRGTTLHLLLPVRVEAPASPAAARRASRPEILDDAAYSRRL